MWIKCYTVVYAEKICYSLTTFSRKSTVQNQQFGLLVGQMCFLDVGQMCIKKNVVPLEIIT